MSAVGAQARPSRAQAAYIFAAGLVCHLAFAAAVIAMMALTTSGMTRGLGRVAPPWGWAANALLAAQFVAGHSLLLGRRGGRVLRALAPRGLGAGGLGAGGLGATLATTTYATVASLQVLALFLLWTPSGIVWWRATQPLAAVILALDACAWLLLLKAILDAGFALQTGLLGWRAAWRGEPPRYPPMPERGLFRAMRQPIYLAFALTVWLVPVWTPDQLVLALALGGYCLFGPRLKEARFRRRYGERFDAYRAATPYWIPRLRRPPR